MLFLHFCSYMLVFYIFILYNIFKVWNFLLENASVWSTRLKKEIVMKKSVIFILIAVVCLAAFVGCGQKNKADFEFSYTIDRVEYSCGEVIELTASLKNISGRVISYTGSSGDFFPEIKLYCMNDGSTDVYCIEHDPIPLSTDVVERWVKHGAVGSRTFYFSIPEDAVCGTYSISLYYGEESCEFDGVLEIVERE